MNGLPDEFANSYVVVILRIHILMLIYAEYISLLAVTGTTMQNLLDVSRNYGIANHCF